MQRSVVSIPNVKYHLAQLFSLALTLPSHEAKLAWWPQWRRCTAVLSDLQLRIERKREQEGLDNVAVCKAKITRHWKVASS